MVSITTVVVAELILMLVLNLLFLGSLEVHTSQSHPIKGTPVLVPDPKKLEKYKALKKAYDNYKTLEALIQENDTKD